MKVEREVLKNTDLVIFTTEATREKYKREFNIDGKVIPMGVDLDLFRSNRINDVCLDKESFNIIYTGVAYGHRNLGLFLRAFRELIIEGSLSLKLYLIGDISEHFRKEISDLKLLPYVKVMEWVDYVLSIGYMKMADLLLLLGNKSSDQIPGKTYMYLGSNRPILYISHDLFGDPTIDVLKDFDGVLLSNYTVSDIKRNITIAYHTYFQKHRSICREVNKKYSWENLSAQLIYYINSLYG